MHSKVQPSGDISLPHRSGTPQALTGSAGGIAWRGDYSPFGQAATTGSLTFNLRFPGQYFDAETGLHYNWHRYYDPSTGRYITSDPIGLEGGLNTYAYVEGNPLGRIDPYGLAGANPWDRASLTPAHHCAAVMDCVETLQSMEPVQIPVPSRHPMGEALKTLLEEAVKNGAHQMICGSMNACQCDGTCPDVPAWPPTEDVNEEGKEEDNCE